MAAGDAARVRKTSATGDNNEEGAYELILKLEEPLQEFVQDDLTSKSSLFNFEMKKGPCRLWLVKSYRFAK